MRYIVIERLNKYIINMTNEENQEKESQEFASSSNEKELIPQEASKMKSNLAIIIGAVVAVAFLGAGVFAYFQYYQNSLSEVMHKMMNNLSEVKAMDYLAEIKVDMKLSESYKKNLAEINPEIAGSSIANEAMINISHAFDRNVDEETKEHFSLAVSSDILSKELDSLALELIALSDNIYLKLDKIPTIGIFDLNSVLGGKWWNIPLDDIKENIGAETIDEVELISELSEQQEKDLKDLFVNNSVFEFNSNLGDQEVDGFDCYHYSLIINKEELKNNFKASLDILEISQKKEGYDKEYIEEQLLEFNKTIDGMKFSELELWITKDEYLPKKLSFSIDVASSDNIESLKIDFNFLFNSFNQVLDINTPEPSFGINELIAEFFPELEVTKGESGMSESYELINDLDIEASLEGDFELSANFNSSFEDEYLTEMDEGISEIDTHNLDSDGDGLSDYDEINIYGSDPFNADTDGDGYSDYEEIMAGYNPLGEGRLLE